MNTFTKSLVLVIGVAALLVGGFFLLNTYIYNEKQADEPAPDVAGYFQEQMTTLGVERVGQPIEGFSAMMLMDAFPGLVPQDFDEVEAFEGHYTIEGGEAVFEPTDQQMMTSAAETVSNEGYATLLENLSGRLSMPVMDEGDVDEMIDLISEPTNGQTDGQMSIAMGEEGESMDVRITVLEVLEDSRCPVDADCIWEGTVRVRATLESGLGTADQVFELGQMITTEAEEVTFVGVDPAPLSEQTIEEGEYVFHFEIRKR